MATLLFKNLAILSYFKHTVWYTLIDSITEDLLNNTKYSQ